MPNPEPTPSLHEGSHRRPPPAPHLFEVLDCASPLRPSARHLLAAVDEVLLCRGEHRKAHREGGTLRLFVPDRFMSSEHARLRRDGNAFRLEDLKSKNGTLRNGRTCESEPLGDNDQIEVGRTQLVFRAALQRGTGAPDVEAGDAPGPTPELTTMMPPFQDELSELPVIARSAVGVIVYGESGTGKELVARALHTLSGRHGEFVAVNCGAIPRELVVSELFGHRRGAFADAKESRPGLIRAADRGTFLLDEIGDLPAQGQVALLRVLQEKEVLGVGETRPVKVDVRVVAATHVDLEAKIGVQEFRADLFARLQGFTIRMPALRHRRADLGLITRHLLRKVAPERAESISFTAEAGRALMLYRWPLNIRELEHCLASAVVLAKDGVIEAAHLPPAVQRAGRGEHVSPVPGLEPAKSRPPELKAEDALLYNELCALLREHDGNIAAVARVMGKARMQIHRWVERFGIDLADFRRYR